MAAVIMARPVPGLVSIIVCVAFLQACAGSAEEAAMPVLNEASLHVQWRNDTLLNEGKPLTAIVFSLQPNKHDTATIVCFREGKEHGSWKKFYENNRLAESRQYNNGQKTGDLLAWWPDGKQKLSYHFKNGEFNGICRDWAANGTLVKEMTYSDGYETGSQKQFYNDGTIKANYVIIDGRRYGLLGTKNCVNVSASIFKK